MEAVDAMEESGTPRPGHGVLAERFLALLFTAGEPLATEQVAALLDVEAGRLPALAAQARARLAGVVPFDIREVAHGWQLVLTGATAEWVRAATGQRAAERLSSAAWEVLSVVAYRQPVTRLEIEAIRGVASDHAVDTLVTRGLVGEVGRKEVPGRPILYATTDRFLEVFGLADLDALPPAPPAAGSAAPLAMSPPSTLVADTKTPE